MNSTPHPGPLPVRGGEGEATAVVLSPAQELAESKAIITDALERSTEAARHLLKIREKKLYLLEADTFEAFCRKNWKYGASRARQICAEARVVSSLALPAGSVTPGNASQVRALLGLPVADRAAAWAQALATAPEGGVTRSHVEQIVRARKAELGLSVTRGNALEAERELNYAQSVTTGSGLAGGTPHGQNGAEGTHGTNGQAASAIHPPIHRSINPTPETREARMIVQADRAITELRALLDVCGTPRSEIGAGLLQALEQVEKFRGEQETLQASRA